MRFRLVAALVAVAVASLGAGCSGSPPTPAADSAAIIPSLVIGTTFPESSLDETKDGYAYVILALGEEGLVKLGPQGQLELYLATSMAHPAPQTYVFNLRHGVKFWDGSELTAADVAYSLNYYARAQGSQAYYTFPTVKTVAATGRYSVTVTLTHADPSFLYGLTNAGYIFQKKFGEAHQGQLGTPEALTMGTGPWRITSFDPTRGAELTANPDWWGGKVPIQHISFKFFANDTSAALAFRAGEIDLDPFVVGAKSFAATSGAPVLTALSPCTGAMLSMNTQMAPWNDIHVRRAVAYALNRQDIIAAQGGYAAPNYTFIPPGLLQQVGTASQVNALVQSLPSYRYDLAKAKQELAQSAYPHGFSASLLAFVYGNVVNTAEAIAAELQKIGINLQVKAVTVAAWSALETGPPDKRPTSYFSDGCNTPDVSGYNWFLGSQNLQAGQSNTADWAPPEVDTLLSQGLTAPDAAGRFAAYSKLLRILAADVPYVPLMVRDNSIALSSKFTYVGYSQYSAAYDGPYALYIKPRA